MTPPAELVKRYAIAPEILTYASQGLSPELQTAKVGPGAWSIAELVAHLADCELVHAVRFRFILAEDNPILPGFEENLWLEKLRSKDAPVEESTALFTASRNATSRILKACSDADFARIGQHSERGPETLAVALTYAVHHVDHHLKFLYGKRATLGVSIYPRYVSE